MTTDPDPTGPTGGSALSRLVTCNEADTPNPEPALFQALTLSELEVLAAHLGSGWRKQGVVYPILSMPWWETNWLLIDIHAATEIVMKNARAGHGS